MPFYNNADLLGDCLAAIAGQTMSDLAVIMVDDGSTDGSADVAAARAAADDRFTLLRVANGGPGSARNRGVLAATAEFLAFVDADDLLPPDAYEKLLGVLEQGTSDFVSGGVLRLTGDGLGPSGLHDQAIKTRRLGTHISAAPELCYDISVWNKVFRRSFWDEAGLSFPEGMLWEDLVAMTKAHVLARAVDVITDPVYHWRDRDKGAPSITQSRTSVANFRDRITALGLIDDFLRARATPALLRHHQHKALVNDLWLYVRDLPATDADYQREFVALAGSYLRQVDRRVTRAQPSTRKLAYYLISRDRQADLVEYASWLAANPGRTPPMTRSFGRLRADLPLRRSRGRGRRVSASVFRPRWRELDPHVGVNWIYWRDKSLMIEGSAYVPSVDIARRRNATKLVVLRPRTRGRPPILLTTRPVHRPDLTQEFGQGRYSYDWAGFSCEVNPKHWFDLGLRWITGDWDCYVLVRGRGVWRPARLHSPGPGAEQPALAEIAPGVWFGAYWAGRRLRVRLTREKPAAAMAPAATNTAAATVSAVATTTAVDSPPVRSPAAAAAPTGEVDSGIHPRKRGWIQGSTSGGVAGGRGGFGDPPRAGRVTVEQTWTADGKLVLRGTLPESAAHQIVLRHLGGWVRQVVPIPAPSPAMAEQAGQTGPAEQVGQAKPGDFRVEVPVAAMDVFGDHVPLRDGRWSISLRSTANPAADQADLVPTVATTTDTREIRAAGKTFRCSADPKAGLILHVAPVLKPIERGRIRRRLLRDLYYPLQRRLPLRDTILFVSFDGHGCNDSPLAIATELRRRADQREQIWAVRDRAVPVPAGATTVLIGTADYFAALGRSRYLIANDHMAQPHRNRPGQRYVQTWHGTPLKRLGYDIIAPTFASGRRFYDFMAGDVTQWDLLISPNPFSTPIMRAAFKYAGEIAETGYPRDDALLTGQTPAKTAATRRRVGLPPGKRVAMYVPTWRDNQHDGSVYRLEFSLDLAAARRRLADDYVLLIRGHHLMAGWELAATEPGFVIDVTAYPDINDLLGVTDVLITDYSSVMFDFASTDRPMLFFTYDLEQYRDQVRGFYFDFEAAAPGPLLTTSDEVIAALADIDAVATRYQRARAEFTARFCPLDDGKAAARACDRIFKG